MMDISNALLDFISDYWSYDKQKINASATLDDLGMFGNDKYDFLIEYSKMFNVDISSIDFKAYVEPEPSLIMHLDSLSRFLFRKKITKEYDVKKISVAMLINSIEKGVWIDQTTTE